MMILTHVRLTEWSLSANDLINTLDQEPNCDLYNLIYTSMYGKCTLNEYGYAKTENKNVSLNISAVASHWESLVTGKPSVMQIVNA